LLFAKFQGVRASGLLGRGAHGEEPVRAVPRRRRQQAP